MNKHERFLLDEAAFDAADFLDSRRNISTGAAAAGMGIPEYVRTRRLRSFLRRKADRLGLAYWPALFQRGCDPRAFVAAEHVLYRKTGELWGTKGSDGFMYHGGWDMDGYHGISPYHVRNMWFASGCRNNKKFRFQVRHWLQARKSDTLPWLVNYKRGLLWLHNNHLSWLYISRKAVAALGRLSPELRRAALQKFFNGERNDKTIRIRDLDWNEVRRVRDAILAGGQSVRAALSGLRRGCQLLGIKAEEEELARRLAPSFPKVPLQVARRVALGHTPVEIAGGVLTRAEAHEWMLDGAPASIAGWLSEYLDLPYHRSVLVIRWMDHCRKSGRWNSLERERQVRVHGRDGEEETRTISLLQILDEVQEEDVQTGRDSVEAVFRRAVRRTRTSPSMDANDTRPLVKLPAWSRELPKQVKLLRTCAELTQEGNEMNHCVGGYASAVARGDCHILSIKSKHGRSTVELDPDLNIKQHKGPHNNEPPSKHVALVKATINRIKKRCAVMRRTI